MIKKIKSSLSLKVFFGMLLLLSICSLFIYITVMVVMPKTYKSEVSSEFTKNLNTLLRELENTTYQNSSKIIYNFCIDNHAYVTLENKTDKINYGFSDTAHSANNEGTGMLTAVTNFHFRDSSELFILEASASERTTNQIAEVFIKLLPFIILLIFITSSISAFLCAQFFTRPISKISAISKKMSDLDMTCRCKIDRSDEIGVLANSLNNMAENLNNAMIKLKIANENLQKDIKRERCEEKKQHDFFVAVSHELKTPITILKGQIESMLYGIGVYKDRDKYLKEALKTTDEMEQLVKEILMLSKMSTGSFKLQLSSINISKLLTDSCLEYKKLCEKKQITFHMNIEQEIIRSIDEKLFRKVLSNVILNAIKHSPSKEEVFVALYSENNFTNIVVENTGVFIDESKLEQLYMPFYRLDKSHSRDTGGSGLGLYIVKTILELHNIKYEFKNTDIGVRFVIKL